jgi:hypothetical protein
MRRSAGIFASLAVLAVGISLTLTACAQKGEDLSCETEALSRGVVGTWFAYHNNAIESIWTFRKNGTCTNDGWYGKSNSAPPFRFQGNYRVGSDRITVTMKPSSGELDTTATYVLENPEIIGNRLVYNAGSIPFIFLREKAKSESRVPEAEKVFPTGAQLRSKLIGDWKAYSNRFPTNSWRFSEDGRFVNEGWSRMGPYLVKRLYRVTGRYEVTGQHVVLSNEKVLRFDPRTSDVAEEIEIPALVAGTTMTGSEEAGMLTRIILYNAVFSRDRLVYTNTVGLPLVFSRGSVTPTMW